MIDGRAALALPVAMSLGACLDPLVSDEVVRPELIRAAGDEPPNVADFPVLRDRLDQFDGVDGALIPLRSAFADGAPVWYWDLGVASPQPIPLYMLVMEAEGGFLQGPDGRTYNPVPGHGSIFDAIPGDPGYSPWWSVVMWPVTDRYHDEVIASFDAMDEAYRQGLVGASIPLPMAVNCPVVLPEARLEIAPEDRTRVMEPFSGYYKGYAVSYFGFDVAFMSESRVATPPLYVLRREGGEPLSEVARGVDITRDGDLLDGNELFAAVPGDADYTGMVELVDAVVADAELIDRTLDDATSALMDAATLFLSTGAPDPSRVVALHPEGIIVNRPLFHPVVPE